MPQMMVNKIVLLGCILSISGYDLSCPHPSQRAMRVHDKCNGSLSSYTCLYDTEKKSNIEMCANKENNFVRAGLKYVITGTLRNVLCSNGRFQPIRFRANQSSECLYSKSKCNGIGQIVYDNRSTIYDASCRCDYIRGYAFVSEPRNKCFCTSSEEDCSCYIKQCPNHTFLSPDYECASATLIQEQYNCQPLKTKQYGNETEMTVPFQDDVQFKAPMRFGRILFIVMSVCCVIAGIVVGVCLVFDRIIVHQRDSKHINGKIMKSDNSYVQNINIESQSNEAFPTPNDNSLLSESDINVIRKPNNIDNISLISACQKGDLSKVNSLIERGADINIIDKDGDTSLSLVCEDGQIDIAILLIDQGCDINKPDKFGMTPLMKACRRRHLPIVALLIEKGADINTTDKDENTPFMWSCEHGTIDIVNLLIDKGCDIHKPNNIGMAPLMKACRVGNMSIVACLIERGAAVNITDNDRNTLLALSCEYGNMDIANLLIDNGCDINKPNNDGMTPLMNACRDGYLPMITNLIEKGADINTTDKDGDTPLSFFCVYGNIEMINLLIDKGCDIHKPNNIKTTPLMKACLYGYLPIVACLIESGADINTTDKDGDTPFSLACDNGNIGIVNLLIDKGCDINKPNYNGRTPLMNACRRGLLSIVARLIEKGADINIADTNGETATTWASKGDFDGIINLLLNKVSDEHQPNYVGKSPLEKGFEKEDMISDRGTFFCNYFIFQDETCEIT